MKTADTDSKSDAFKKKLVALFKPGDDPDPQMPLKQQKALRDEKIAALFEERLQTMLLDGILKEIEDSGQSFDEAALQELQNRLLSAKSSKDMMKWPVPGMEQAWTVQDFVDGLMANGKKSADEMSQMTGALVKGIMAQAKAFATVAEFIDAALSVLKEEGIQFLKADMTDLIKLKVLEKSALMQNSLVDSTSGLNNDAIKEAIQKITDGFIALHEKKAAAGGGTRRGRKRKRRTQRYRAKFSASDFF